MTFYVGGISPHSQVKDFKSKRGMVCAMCDTLKSKRGNAAPMFLLSCVPCGVPVSARKPLGVLVGCAPMSLTLGGGYLDSISLL